MHEIYFSAGELTALAQTTPSWILWEEKTGKLEIGWEKERERRKGRGKMRGREKGGSEACPRPHV